MQRLIASTAGLNLWTQAFGRPERTPVLLVMGAMNQSIFWPDQFCQDLADAGLYVVRYDHRDTGNSSRIDFKKNSEGLKVFSHIFVAVSDFARALNFYTQVLSKLNIEQRFVEPDKPWAGWHSAGGTRPYFVICKPFNGEPHDPGNGQMVAFRAINREGVQSAYQTAMALGGRCEGPPGLRPHYHQHYYGAYFRDPDGNKICIACHQPPPTIHGAPA